MKKQLFLTFYLHIHRDGKDPDWNAIGFLAGGKGQTAEDELRENLGEIPKLAE